MTNGTRCPKAGSCPRKTGKPFTTSRPASPGACLAPAPADSQERKIAATICGQEKLKEAIPRLRELLADTEHVEYFTLAVPPWIRVYPVREAAKEALRNMDEACEEEVVEQPKPSKTSN